MRLTSKQTPRGIDIPTMTAWLQQPFRPRVECVYRGDEHQWDALIIELGATWQGFSGRWIADLAADAWWNETALRLLDKSPIIWTERYPSHEDLDPQVSASSS